MHAFVDSDWAGDLDRHSQSGFIFMMQGGPVSWLSKKQPTIALSSTEAEIAAAVACTQDAMWFMGCMKEMKTIYPLPMLIYEDNAGAIALSQTSVIGKRTRHVDIKYKFLNECVEAEKVRLIKVDGANNMADILTKPLPKNWFRMLSARMAHSTSLLVPQPMTADQDGPTRCLGSYKNTKDQCKRNALRGYHLCKNHKQQEDGVTCIGYTLAGARCLAGTIEGSVFRKPHSVAELLGVPLSTH